MSIGFDDPELDGLATQLRAEFEGLTFDRELDLPKRRASLALGVAVLVVIATVATLLVRDSDHRSAWAAKPKPVSTADTARVVQLCSMPVSPGAANNRPVALPPLLSIDSRGERVVAAFAGKFDRSGAPQTFSACSLRWSNDRLVRDDAALVAVTVLPELALPPVGDRELTLMMTIIVRPSPHDEPIAFTVGSVGADVTRVVVSGDRQPDAEATVREGRFSIWMPESTFTAGTTVTAYRADGSVAATLPTNASRPLPVCLAPPVTQPGGDGRRLLPIATPCSP